MKKFSAIVAVFLGILAAPLCAHALTINIDALVNTTANPVTEFLTAGTYNVTMIGIADQGDFDAWNAWGGNTSGNMGWLNSYRISSDQFDTISMGDGIRYKDPLEALDNALATSFTLAADGLVNFYIADSNYRDNIGGISLNVAPTPEPGTIVLLGLGLAGIAFGVNRRKK